VQITVVNFLKFLPIFEIIFLSKVKQIGQLISDLKILIFVKLYLNNGLILAEYYK
jgi:hypothetical protein